jgi:hypothetical protein
LLHRGENGLLTRLEELLAAAVPDACARRRDARDLHRRQRRKHVVGHDSIWQGQWRIRASNGDPSGGKVFRRPPTCQIVSMRENAEA